MATIVGNAGYSALKRGGLSVVIAVVGLTCIAAMIVAYVAFSVAAYRSWFLVAAFVVVVGLCAYYFRDLKETFAFYLEGRNFIKGSKGEMKVVSELSKLPDGFVVFNDLHPRSPSGEPGAWNVDHVVIGPTGVFVVETKNYSTTRVTSAQKDDFTRANVAQAQRNALELKDRLKTWSAGALAEVFVVPIVVYAQEGAFVESLRENAVRVVPLRLLNAQITKHTERAIDMDRASRIARVLYEQMPVGDRVPFEQAFLEWSRLARQRVVPKSVQPAADSAAGTATTVASEAPKCPKCGTVLIVRTAKSGQHKGNTFLACPRYPECRHTQSLS